MKTVLSVVLSGVLILGGTAHAAKKTPVKNPSKSAKPVLVCPITGEKVASVKASAGTSVFKGKTYYFCCGGCKPEFDKNPGFYASKFQAKVDKLSKESKDKKPS